MLARFKIRLLFLLGIFLAGQCCGGLGMLSPAFAAVPTGEILQLDFEEGTGVIAHDSSGKGNHATLNGDVTWVPGKDGGNAVRLNGTDASFLTIVDDDSLDFINTDFSISFDMRPKSDFGLIKKNKTVMKKQVTGTTYWSLWFQAAGDPRLLYFSLANETANDWARIEKKPWYTDNWTNILITYNAESKTVKMYRDGALRTRKVLGNAGMPSSGNVVADLVLFKELDAEFDNLNIFNREITAAAEIANLAFGGEYSQRVYYVAATGSDANQGEIDSPLATVARAAAIALPGDTIRIKGGIYNESGIIINESGYPGHPIQIEAYDGKVLMQGNSDEIGFIVSNKSNISFDNIDFNGYKKGISCTNGQNITVKNTDIENITDNGLYFNNCSEVMVDNIHITNSTGDGIEYYILENSTLSNITVDNVTYGIIGHKLNNSVINNFIATNAKTGIESIGADGTTITNFNIQRMTTDGMQFKYNNRNLTISDGYIEDTRSHGIHVTEAYNLTFRNITFWDNWHNQLDLHNEVEKVLIEGCSFSYHDNEWITSDVVSIYLHNFNISDITINDNNFNYTPRPLEIFNTRDLTVTNNSFRNICRPDNSTSYNRWLLIGSIDDSVQGGPEDYPERGLIKARFENNIIYGPHSYGISFYAIGKDADYPLGSADIYFQDITFKNNIYKDMRNEYFFFYHKVRMINVIIDDIVEKNALPKLAYLYGQAAPIQAENVFLGENMLNAFPQNRNFAFTEIPEDSNTHLLLVSGGTGSGSYAAGQQVTISANTPPQGRTFAKWTGDTQYIASATSATTQVTMPGMANTLVATYKEAKSGLDGSNPRSSGGTGGMGGSETGNIGTGGMGGSETGNIGNSGDTGNTVGDNGGDTSGNIPEQKHRRIELLIGSKIALENGVNKEMDVAPVILNNRTMVPLRFIGEVLGATFAWEEATRTVTYRLGEQEMRLVIEQPIVGFDTPPTIIDGRTMVPVRYIAEYFGAEVGWDPVRRSVTVVK